jgi:integrase
MRRALSRADGTARTLVVTGVGGSLASPAASAVFNFALALPGRASSRHSHRAYFRWVDTYLSAVFGWPVLEGEARRARMAALPVPALETALSASQLRAWLGMLAQQGHGRQGLNQARAALVTLADLVAESGFIADETAAAMARVRVPRAEDGQRQGRWLSADEIHRLIAGFRAIASNETALARNAVLVLALCTMALRREEASAMRWHDLSLQNNRVVLRVHGKGRKAAPVDVPRPLVNALERWRAAMIATGEPPMPNSPLLRRLWKGGRASRFALTADGVWLLVNEAAEAAHLGAVAPHDLRRSVAGALFHSGVPIETVSRLLRHSSIAITERYLNRLPQPNEGAVLMSDLLGFGDG